MSTEIPEPAPQAPAADQPDQSAPAGQLAAGSLSADGASAQGAWLTAPEASDAAEASAAAGLPKLPLVGFADLRAAVLVAVVSVVLCLPVAALWVWLAPAVQGTLSQGAVYYTSPESKEFVGQDGTLGIICFVLGLLCGGLGYVLFHKKGAAGAALGLAGGGLLGGYLATKAAGVFGPGHGKTILQMVVGMHDNTVFSLPLQLRAVGVLWFWPLAAIAVYLILTILLGPVEPTSDPSAAGADGTQGAEWTQSWPGSGAAAAATPVGSPYPDEPASARADPGLAGPVGAAPGRPDPDSDLLPDEVDRGQ
jgi:hypothetical protein